MGRVFFGGIHPAPRKESTRRKPLVPLESAPAQVVLPLRISTGTPAVPTVRVGDRVLVGQPIALPQGDEGAIVHASVSGVVSAIQDSPHPWWGSAPAIVIKNDKSNRPWREETPAPNLSELSQEAILALIQTAGITDMGADPAPAQVKILRARGRVDTLIVDSAESDLYLTADHRLMLEQGELILLGTRALGRVLGVNRSVLVAEGDMLNAIEALERRVSRRKSRIELKAIRTRYPLGAEKQIVQAVTGREVPPGGSAVDARCCVFNVAAAFAVGEALAKGTPLIHRAVTVTGGSIARPRNLWVPIGTPMKHLVSCAGGFREEPSLMLTGGPMAGLLQENLEAPVLANTNGLLCLAPWENPKPVAPTVCIRCGLCVSVCPMHLSPIFINRAAQEQEHSQLAALHPGDCMACGCCSYICPAHIQLTEIVQAAIGQLQSGDGSEAAQ